MSTVFKALKAPNGRRCRPMCCGRATKRDALPFSCFVFIQCATTTAEKKKVRQILQFRQFALLHIRCLYIFYSVVRLLGFVLWVLLLIRNAYTIHTSFWPISNQPRDIDYSFWCRPFGNGGPFLSTLKLQDLRLQHQQFFCRFDILSQSTFLMGNMNTVCRCA